MNARPAALAVPFAAGAATALALGIYASVHEPTGRDFVLTGFSSASSWKSMFASVTVVLFFVQISLGLRIAGRLGPRLPPPPWARDVHRLVGTIAFGMSIPVVFHCLWTLGYRADDTRLALHSLLGCVAYGLYVAQVLTVRSGDRPEWAVPVTGAMLGIAMIVAWWTSALYFYAGIGS
ncbi:MAG: DUF6529 family protein [Acidimicrobiales bacterium]